MFDKTSGAYGSRLCARVNQLGFADVSSDLSGAGDLYWGVSLPAILPVRVDWPPIGSSRNHRAANSLMVYLPRRAAFRSCKAATVCASTFAEA
jgi:hypothetical protein